MWRTVKVSSPMGRVIWAFVARGFFRCITNKIILFCLICKFLKLFSLKYKLKVYICFATTMAQHCVVFVTCITTTTEHRDSLAGEFPRPSIVIIPLELGRLLSWTHVRAEEVISKQELVVQWLYKWVNDTSLAGTTGWGCCDFYLSQDSTWSQQIYR